MELLCFCRLCSSFLLQLGMIKQMSLMSRLRGRPVVLMRHSRPDWVRIIRIANYVVAVTAPKIVAK